MKKLLIVFVVFLFSLHYFGCSDDTVSEQKNVVNSTSFVRFNDSLAISVNIQNTTVSHDWADSVNYSILPKVIYEVRPTNGSLDFYLYDNLDSIIFLKRFTGYSWDTISLNYIPIRYFLRMTDFAGAGFIKVTKVN